MIKLPFSDMWNIRPREGEDVSVVKQGHGEQRHTVRRNILRVRWREDKDEQCLEILAGAAGYRGGGLGLDWFRPWFPLTRVVNYLNGSTQ